MLDLKTFILAGKAQFTCTAPDGNHYSYRVNKAIKHTAHERSVWFVNLGISYDSLVYMGLLRDEGEAGNISSLIMTKGSRVGSSWPSYTTFVDLWSDARNGTWIDDSEPGRIITSRGIRFQHVGKCCVCGRPLTNPTSIDAGIGPECSGRLGV